MGWRRTQEGEFLFLPCKEIEQLFKYIYGWACEERNVELHALTVMLNHPHPIYTALDDNDPDFRRDVHSLIGRAVNALRKRYKMPVFAPPDRGYTRILDEAALIEAIGYVAAQPVAAGLLKYGRHWPGVRTRPEDIGKTEIIKRPNFFFPPDSIMPEQVEFTLTMPPQLRHLPRQEAVDILRNAVDRAETTERRQWLAKGHKFPGLKGLKKLSHTTKCPLQYQSGKIYPLIKCKDRKQRIKAKRELTQFRADHRTSRTDFREGNHDVQFPHGTYWYRVHAGARCASTCPT
jgi:putative transposase